MQNYGSQPPAGQQAIGILNIVFGVLGAIIPIAGLAMGGLLGAVGAAGAGGGSEAAPIGGLIAASGVMLMVFSLIFLVISIILIVGGVGILKMASWGRTVTLVYAGVAVLINVAQLVMTGFHSILCNAVGLIYPIVLLVVLNQDDWKSAFSGS